MDLAIVSLIVSIITGLLAITILLRLRGDTSNRLLDAVRQELRSNRSEAADLARYQREELRNALDGMNRNLQESQAQFRGESADQVKTSREELSRVIRELQQGNEKKLEEMRQTVDEKLQGTLEKRLGESFELVSKRLEAVHQGLGEMQQLAAGVDDLKRAIGNVKTLGIFGESQLRALLEQFLSAEQFVTEYRPREDSGEKVEFAIVMPGLGGGGSRVYLPVDSKFPQQDYLRLVEAVEQAEPELVKAARTGLVRSIKQYARSISSKYIQVPQTTNFAILFLPTEGLYAEVLRFPGLMEELQREHSITLVGPSTLAAYLMALRLGFRSVAISEQSEKVWRVLGAVRSEFTKFGSTLDRVKKQLAAASSTIEQTSVRTRAMERQLRGVDTLQEDEAEELFGLIPGKPEADGDGSHSSAEELSEDAPAARIDEWL